MLLFRELSLSYPKVECYVFFAIDILEGGTRIGTYVGAGCASHFWHQALATRSIVLFVLHFIQSTHFAVINPTKQSQFADSTVFIYLCFQFLLYNVDACGMVGGSADISYVQNHTEEICVGKGLCAVREVYTVP